MDGQLLIVCFVICGIVLTVVYKISKSILIKKRRERLDYLARNLLSDFNFEKEKREIRSIARRHLPQSHICPRCGGILLVRKGRYGPFLGCNHYPECRYTRNIE